jgi:hypothetical protein
MAARPWWIAIGALALAACGDEERSSARAVAATAPPPAAPAGIPESAAIFVGCGHLLVENHGQTAFTVLLKGEHVHPLPVEEANLWVLDNDLLATITSTSARNMGAPAARGAELLRKYMEWETAYAERQNGWPPIRAGVGLVDEETGDAPVMTWGYTTPAPVQMFDQTITRLLYATAAVDSIVFVVALSLREKDDPALASQTALAALVTLRRSDEPIDPHALSARIQASPPPWPGCGG